MEYILLFIFLFAFCGVLGLIGAGLEAIINRSLDRKDKRIERAEINRNFKSEMRKSREPQIYKEVI